MQKAHLVELDSTELVCRCCSNEVFSKAICALSFEFWGRLLIFHRLFIFENINMYMNSKRVVANNITHPVTCLREISLLLMCVALSVLFSMWSPIMMPHLAIVSFSIHHLLCKLDNVLPTLDLISFSRLLFVLICRFTFRYHGRMPLRDWLLKPDLARTCALGMLFFCCCFRLCPKTCS